MHFCIAMAINTPPHGQVRMLFQHMHLLHRTMTGLAFHFSGLHVLGMTEESVVRQIVYPYPFNWFTTFYRSMDLVYFEAPRLRSVADHIMAVQAETHRWYACGFALQGGVVTIFTIDTVLPGMDLMTEFDGLIWCIVLCAAQVNGFMHKNFHMECKCHDEHKGGDGFVFSVFAKQQYQQCQQHGQPTSQKYHKIDRDGLVAR